MSAQTVDWPGQLERIRRGDPVALLRVTRLITGSLARAGAYRLRDSWEDVCQEVLIKLLRSAATDGLRSPGAFVGYVATVTRNALVDWIRKNRITAPLRGAGWAGREAFATAAPARRDDPDLMLDLERGLARLPKPEREVLDAIYLEGRTYEEAAKRLEIPLGTLKRRQRLGLHRLREGMGLDSTSRVREPMGGLKASAA